MEQTTREAASSFRPYDHVERLGHSEVDGIEFGTCYVFPKIDGTNGCLWWDGGLRCGSRNRECTVDADNQGFAAWAHSDDPKAIALRNFLSAHPHVILYGEWLVPHAIKLYRQEAWRRFYVFDAFDRIEGRYLYVVEALSWLGVDVVMPLCVITNPSKEQLLTQLEQNTYLMQDGAGPGEGIVVKNYEWTNQHGRQPWAKIVRAAFKERHVSTMGAPEIKGATTIELAIVNEFVTPELVGKTRAKILVDVANHDNIDLTEPGAQRLVEETRRATIIPQLLGRVFHDLVVEGLWETLKKHRNPTIDFSVMLKHCTMRVKALACDLFGGGK